MKRFTKVYIWLPLCIALSIAFGIFVGNIYNLRSGGGQQSFGSGSDKLNTIFGYINQAYVDSVDVNSLVEKSIPTILEGLDPHSSYISAESMMLTGHMIEGHFSGIGVEFMLQADTITIVNVIFGGPSEAVGIVPGDKVVAVADTIFAGIGLTNDRVIRTLRGETGSKVKLGIKRSNSDEILNFTVTRAEIPVESIDAAYKIADGIGYIKVNQFATNTFQDFITAVAKLKKEGCTSFIIDLQQNGGGIMSAATSMANEFLQKAAMIVYTEGRAYPRQNEFANGSGTCKDSQLVVLLDESSASASEVFSGAIQDNDRGLIVGRRSFGKGLVQQQHEFKDGSAIRLTVARYHTPSGRCIQKAYKTGNYEGYELDLLNRYKRGEMDNQDSIRFDNLPLFETVGGRPVYGNDGIMPDVFIPRDTTGYNSYYIKIINSGVLREFAFSYVEKNRDKLKSFGTWQKAAEYISKQNLVDQLASYADQKGIRRRPYLISDSYNLLNSQLEALIIRYSWGEEGFYPLLMKDDKALKKAIELIQAKKATPDAIKNMKYK